MVKTGLAAESLKDRFMELRAIVAGATDLTGVAVTRGVMAADNMELVGAVARFGSNTDAPL